MGSFQLWCGCVCGRVHYADVHSADMRGRLSAKRFQCDQGFQKVSGAFIHIQIASEEHYFSQPNVMF